MGIAYPSGAPLVAAGELAQIHRYMSGILRQKHLTIERSGSWLGMPLSLCKDFLLRGKATAESMKEGKRKKEIVTLQEQNRMQKLNWEGAVSPPLVEP